VKRLLEKFYLRIPVSARALVKTTAYSGLAAVIKMVLGVVSNKVNSIYLGPSGYAILGQYTNYASIVSSISTGGINSGLIKYVSEYYDQLEKRTKIISTALFIVLVCSTLTGIASIVLCKILSASLLKTPQYWSIFVISGLMITLNSIGIVISNLLNAFKQMTRLITTQIIMSFISLGVTVPLVIYLNVYGSLLAIFLIAPIAIYLNYKFLLKAGFDIRKVKPFLDLESFKRLAKFSAMALTSALLVPISQIVLRNYIIANISAEAAGYWQGILKFSDMYMAVILSALSLYYLPRLSEIKDLKELRNEIFLGYSILLPAMAFMGLAIFFLRDVIIHVLYTPSFQPMSELFPFQLLGDFFKIASWLLAFLMVAKAKGKLYLITEISFAFSYLTLSILLINKFGLIGITYAYSLNYFIYLILIFYLFRKLVFHSS